MTLLPKLQDHSLVSSPSLSNQVKATSQDSIEDLTVQQEKMDEIQKTAITNLKRSVSYEDANGNQPGEEGTQKKRQRVENIVTNISQPRSPKPNDVTQTLAEQKNKRKQFVPQQHGHVNGDIDVVNEEFDNPTSPKDVNQNSSSVEPIDREKDLLKDQLKIMGEQLHKMQQRYQEIFEKREMERFEMMSRLALHQPQVELETYLRAIKSEINQSVKMAITEVLEKNIPLIKEKMAPTSRESVQRGSTPNQNLMQLSSEPSKRTTPALSMQSNLPQTSHNSFSNPLLSLPLYYGQALSHPPFNTPGLSIPFNNSVMQGNPLQAALENELLENQIFGREGNMNKKKRTKVTDTRLSPRTSKPSDNISPGKQDLVDPGKNFEAYTSGSSLFPSINPSMAAMQSAFFNGYCPRPDPLKSGTRSPTNLSDASDRGTSSPDLSISLNPALPGQNVTLTPLHLRKAKLMFFYVRYPSSVLLKNYFCDVHFNKNNTAQLVKWFSNFREFYYIQMEKYARQSIAEGLTSDQVEITSESELYKILNLHYNRNNQIEVPQSFLETIQVTLKEFIKAVSLGKDREQSWKKPIYKVIARLDDTVPDYFKSQDWMEQLSD